MTNQEFRDFYDSLYYGHDAEIVLNGKFFFIEWSAAGLDLYSMNGDDGVKIATFSAKEKSEIIMELFSFFLEDKKCINDSFSEIILIDIE